MSKRILAKFNTPSNSPGRSIRVIVNEQVPGVNGLPVTLYESVNGKNVPSHRAQLYIDQTPDGSKKWMSLASPIRKMDENGYYITKARTNDVGAFVNHKGEVVQSEKEAARIYDLERDTQGKVLWATVATLNVKNLNKDNQPLKGTMLSAKFFKDSEAKAISDEMKRIKGIPAEQRKPHYDALSVQKQQSGQWTNMFIKEGHDLLRHFGFEAREMPQEPQNEFKDDIPF